MLTYNIHSCALIWKKKQKNIEYDGIALKILILLAELFLYIEFAYQNWSSLVFTFQSL